MSERWWADIHSSLGVSFHANKQEALLKVPETDDPEVSTSERWVQVILLLATAMHIEQMLLVRLLENAHYQVSLDLRRVAQEQCIAGDKVS